MKTADWWISELHSQPSFTSQGGQLVSSATAPKGTGDGRVVEILVYFAAELLVLVGLWLLRLEELIPNINTLEPGPRVLLQPTTGGDGSDPSSGTARNFNYADPECLQRFLKKRCTKYAHSFVPGAFWAL